MFDRTLLLNPKRKFSEETRKRKPPRPHPQERDEDEIFKPISMALVWRLASWLKPYKKMYVWGALAGVTATLLDLAGPWIQKIIIDDVIPSGNGMMVLQWALIWAAVTVVGLGMDAVQIWATARCGECVINDLRLAVFDHLQRLSMGFYDRTRLGQIITRGTSDMEALRPPIANGINTIALNMLKMLGAAATILWADWRLFLAVAWLAPALAICNDVYRRRLGAQWQVVRAGFSRVTANLAENVTGARVVAAFNRQDENLDEFNELQHDNTVNNVRTSHITGMYMPLLELITFSGQLIILAYGGILVLRGGPDAPTSGRVVLAFFSWDKYMSPTRDMGNFYNTLMQAMASCERIFGLLDLKPEVVDLPGATPCGRLQGNVSFEDVTFGYDPAKPVLHGITFDIPAGSTCALVGATGSGKSSTISLLARFYDYQSGCIKVDGRDIRTMTLESLHKQMGLVLQVNYLFSGTVMDNIRYALPNVSDTDVYEAAKSLGLHETFESLPSGYQTQVGERGASVSLGIRQLICFTRVLVSNPGLFLLDEATASIDTVTEVKIQTALEKLVRGRTTIVVAHRLSTIVKADCIVVLDNGRIIEKGTHRELIAKDGHYAMLYRKFVTGTGLQEAP